MKVFRKRIIPVLLLKNGGLYKTVQFKDPRYVGDPANAVKIFNEKEVDELIFLDITATKEKREPDYDLIYHIATECFMPFCYGGGIRNIEQIRKIISLGVEKVVINSSAIEDMDFIREAVKEFASSTIVVAIDVKKDLFGSYRIFGVSGTKKADLKLDSYVKLLEESGVGEIFLNSIDRDGVMGGFDLKLIEQVSKNVTIPVIACGGGGSVEDLRSALQHGASSVAAGSFFVFKGKHRAVLINYPAPDVIDELSGV
jgi:cyclase